MEKERFGKCLILDAPTRITYYHFLKNQSYNYTYDNVGNILTKSTSALTAASTTPSSTTSTYNYSYGNANWGDLLTSYRGTTITYDSIGNPLSYYRTVALMRQSGFPFGKNFSPNSRKYLDRSGKA